MGIVFLKDIAVVQTGYSFRNRINDDANGDISVIQMKDLATDFVYASKDFIKIDSDNIRENYLVRKNDLFFKSRGKVNNTSLLIDSIDAVLSAPLLLIRISNNSKILPEYLNWYISSQVAQSYFRSISEGTSQKMISKSALENLEIDIPSIKKQLLITELSSLQRKENEILNMLSEKKEQYYNNVLMNIAKGD